jgi:hypothetical protein
MASNKLLGSNLRRPVQAPSFLRSGTCCGILRCEHGNGRSVGAGVSGGALAPLRRATMALNQRQATRPDERSRAHPRAMTRLPCPLARRAEQGCAYRHVRCLTSQTWPGQQVVNSYRGTCRPSPCPAPPVAPVAAAPPPPVAPPPIPPIPAEAGSKSPMMRTPHESVAARPRRP